LLRAAHLHFAQRIGHPQANPDEFFVRICQMGALLVSHKKSQALSPAEKSRRRRIERGQIFRAVLLP
jgi:hypothetical protein